MRRLNGSLSLRGTPARSEGRIPADLTYEQWEATTLNVANMDGEDDDDDTEGGRAVDPTHAVAEPG
jgi:hypothetical protein